jgi:hypothetical protein
MNQTLWYHKCLHCLTSFSSTEPKIDECDCNSDDVICMGKVYGNTYKQIENRSPCDGRCSHASGPHCDCGCGGINHGTGRMVATVIREGKVKVVDPSTDILDEMKRGYKYREFRDYAYKMCEDDGLQKWAQQKLVKQVDKIVAMRVYDMRLKALVDFIVKNKKAQP